MLRLRLSAVPLLFLLTAFARGGVDPDSLGRELNGFPGMPSIMAGRFNVETEACLRQRIERLEPLIAKSELSDPAAASRFFLNVETLANAYDHLGEPGKGAAILQSGLVALDEFGKSPGSRALAASNRSRLLRARARTLRHSFEQTGNKESLSVAIQCFLNAFEINPPPLLSNDAVELLITEWMELENPDIDSYLDGFSESDLRKFQNGLMGVMVQGDGWDNPDLLEILRRTVVRQEQVSTLGPTSVSYALRRRTLDLLEGNKTTPVFAFDVSTEGMEPGMLDESGIARADRGYEELKRTGQAFRASHTKWLEAGLKAGRHPDTDPKFWEGYVEPPMPNKDVLDGKTPPGLPLNAPAIVGGGVGAFVAAMAVVYRNMKRRRKSSVSGDGQ